MGRFFPQKDDLLLPPSIIMAGFEPLYICSPLKCGLFTRMRVNMPSSPFCMEVLIVKNVGFEYWLI
jgi:hypothetical protein